jgi:hypothetical protein
MMMMMVVEGFYGRRVSAGKADEGNVKQSQVQFLGDIQNVLVELSDG